jgi:phosphoglycolate phosphatase
MPFRAVIFDLDGTLLNSIKGIADAMNLLLEELGYPIHAIDRYRYFVGDGIEQLVKRSLPTDYDYQEQIEQLVAEYRKIYDRVWPLETVPYPGIPELLDRLVSSGMKMAVLSNKADDFSKRMVAELLPGWTFDAVLGSRPGIPVKPAPHAALEIAGTLGLKPGEIVLAGDSGVDMQTAVQAGMYPLGVLWGFRDVKELLANGAKKLISRPARLAELALEGFRN